MKVLLEVSLHTLKENIGEELSREVNVCWKKEELAESVNDVCTVVIHKERPFRSEDNGLKLSPAGHVNLLTIIHLSIHDTTHNIFVTDTFDPILVFNKDGNYLYDVPISIDSVGIALTSDIIYASSQKCLLKINKSNNKCNQNYPYTTSSLGIDIRMSIFQ